MSICALMIFKIAVHTIKAPSQGMGLYFPAACSLLLLFRRAVFSALIEGRVKRVEVFAVELIRCNAQTFAEAALW